MTVDEVPPRGEPVVGLGAMDRIGNPEEIASAILFLASERCGFLTGETFVVDGGQLIFAPDPAPSASDG
jgi:NAD(P)-dependent dehydrogenase (short-subunit alcohol dehydrogenase family)